MVHVFVFRLTTEDLTAESFAPLKFSLSATHILTPNQIGVTQAKNKKSAKLLTGQLKLVPCFSIHQQSCPASLIYVPFLIANCRTEFGLIDKPDNTIN